MRKLAAIENGAIRGAINFSALTMYAVALLSPRLARDGQTGMIVFYTAPIGAVLGAIAAAVTYNEHEDSMS